MLISLKLESQGDQIKDAGCIFFLFLLLQTFLLFVCQKFYEASVRSAHAGWTGQAIHTHNDTLRTDLPRETVAGQGCS